MVVIGGVGFFILGDEMLSFFAFIFWCGCVLFCFFPRFFIVVAFIIFVYHLCLLFLFIVFVYCDFRNGRHGLGWVWLVWDVELVGLGWVLA